MSGPEGESLISNQEEQAKEQGEKIRRPTIVAGQTYARESTVFKEGSRVFGEINIRKDHGTELHMTPQERYDFIRACVLYGRLSGRIGVLTKLLEVQEKIIRKMTDANEGLGGIESNRLGVSVTDVPEILISPDPKEVRKAGGSAFPQFGTEQVVATITVPEEQQPSGEVIRAERVREFISLAARFMGMSRESVETNVVFQDKMKVTDREALFAAVNSGLIPESALGLKRSKKIVVNPLGVKKRIRRARKKADTSNE